MPKNIISTDDRQEIRSAMAGLSGARAKAEAQLWATRLDCHISRIYEITEDVRPPRKQRTDSGKRRADIDHPMVRFALECVVANRLDPDLAIETVLAQPEFAGQEFPISLGSFRRLLRERGLDRKQRRSPRHAFRSWEAKAPLERFQFDISGLKQRWWYDISNRRILRVNELQVSGNHPNENRNRVQVWSFHLVDDYSRFRYVRFVAVDKPNSGHVIDFLLECFRNLGIPLALYTDNDPIIVCKRMRRAASILDRAFAESGGFKLEQHTPGRPQATGKVEAGHRICEKFWNLIGLKRVTPDLKTLNKLAANVCDGDSRVPSRATGIAPLLRFNQGHQAIRIPPPALLDSAFKATPYRLSVAGNLTIRVEGATYQLPRAANLRHNGQNVPNPFLGLAGRRGDAFKIDVVWPPAADYFVCIVDGRQYEFDRVLATPDAAGEFRAMPESIGQQTEKIIRASARARRAANKEAGVEIVTPGIDVPLAAQVAGAVVAGAQFNAGTAGVSPASSLASSQSGISNLESGISTVAGHRSSVAQPGAVAANTSMFPRKRIETDPALIAALAPGAVPPSMMTGQIVNRWTAAEQLQAVDLLPAELTSADKAWLDRVFAGRDEMLDTELRALLADRVEEEIRTVSGSARVVQMRETA